MPVTDKVHYLIVSKRNTFCELVRFVLEWQYDCVVTTNKSESQALEYLRGIDIFPHMIIYDYEPGAFLVEDFIAYIKASKKPVHFLVLAEKVTEEWKDYFAQLRNFHLVPKEELWNRIFGLSRESFKTELIDNHSPWCRMHFDCIMALNGADKDLYVKLPSGRYLRLFESGAAGVKDLQRYREKGMEFFWLERPTCSWMVDQIRKQFHIFITNTNFQFVLRGPGASKDEDFENKIIRVCGELHLDPEFKREVEMLMVKVLDAVSKNIKATKIMQLMQDKRPEVSYFAKNLQLMSIISCFMAKKMEWNSKATLEKLVYASVVHDLTLATKTHLQRIPHLQAFEDMKSTLSEEDQKIFLEHPREAAQLIKTQFKFAPPETDVLVLQHHELPGGLGFPGKVPADRLSPLSQLFIVCQDFVRFIMNEEDPILEVYFLRAEARFEHNSFRRFITLLKKFKSGT